MLTFAMARDLCPPQVAGMAIAFVNTLSMMGGTFFQRGVGQILDWSWSGLIVNGQRVYRVSDYEHAVAIVPICLGIATLISLVVSEKKVRKFRHDSVKPHHFEFDECCKKS